MIVVVRPVFHEGKKCYPQGFLDEYLYKLYMLEYDRIDMSGEIDVSKTDSLHEWIICHYWYFLDISFRFKPEVCDGCHDLM